MAVSGVLVICSPSDLTETTDLVASRSWASVHYCEPDGRMIITIEANDTDQSMERLEEIQKLPKVTLAEMIAYCCEDESHAPIDESGLRTAKALDQKDLDSTGRTR